MEPLTIFYLLLLIALIIAVFYLQDRQTRLAREKKQIQRETMREREATESILALSRDAIRAVQEEDAFLSSFVEYAQGTLVANGAAVFKADPDGVLHGLAVSGGFPPLREVSDQVEQLLLGHADKHTEFFLEVEIPFTIKDLQRDWSDNGFGFINMENRPWMPTGYLRTAPRTVFAPISIGGKIIAVTFVVSGSDFDASSLDENDGRHLMRLNEIAALSLEAIKVSHERRKYAEQVTRAREEGMLQVSTGIIHNIGNALTVARLNVRDLRDNCWSGKENPAKLILDEIIPRLHKKLEEGKLADYLLNDKAGREILPVLKELVCHIADQEGRQAVKIKSLSDKLSHISEIIELQQRFVGELGTENMTSVGMILESSVKIFEESFNRHGIEISTIFSDDTPEILIDTSMMTQVFMNIIKNAMEAMAGDPETRVPKLEIRLRNHEDDDGRWILVQIEDNGPGIPRDVVEKMFEFGFSTKDANNSSSRGFGLHSCRDTVRKYGGHIEVDTNAGRGTVFSIYLPVNTSKLFGATE